MIFKLPSFGVYSSLRDILSDLTYCHFLTDTVKSLRSTFKSINNGVYKVSVLFSTIFPLLIKDFLTALYNLSAFLPTTSSITFILWKKHFIQSQIVNDRKITLAQQISDQPRIFNRDIPCQWPKNSFFTCHLKINFYNNKTYSTKTLISVDIFNTKFSLNDHIIYYAKQVSKRLVVKKSLKFFYTYQVAYLDK